MYQRGSRESAAARKGFTPHVLRGAWWPGERSNLEGYLQGQVRHPSVACGDTSPCRGGFRGRQRTKRLPCKGSWMRRKAQTEGCIAALWRKYPAGSGRVLPRSTRRCRKAPRRARSPTLHYGRKRAATRKRQPSLRPDGGPMQASAPTQGRAAAGRVRLPGRVFARPGAAPLRRLRRHLPLQGRLPGRQHTERLPCKGSWMRRKAQTEGCIAGLRWNYLARSGRALPYVSQRAVLASSRKPCSGPLFPVLPPVCLIL